MSQPPKKECNWSVFGKPAARKRIVCCRARRQGENVDKMQVFVIYTVYTEPGLAPEGYTRRTVTGDRDPCGSAFKIPKHVLKVTSSPNRGFLGNLDSRFLRSLQVGGG